jgi:hypothetical protein
MSNRRVKDIDYDGVDDAAGYDGDFEGDQQEGLWSFRDVYLDCVDCS